MSNENLIKTLVETIMKDERFVALMQNTHAEQPVLSSKKLYLIEDPNDISLVPGFPGQPVFCQAHRDGEQGYLDFRQIENAGFEHFILVNPSYNLICKLATGIADEPIARILQSRMALMDGQLSIQALHRVEAIKNPVFGQYIHKQLSVLQSFGFLVSKMTMALTMEKQGTATISSGNLFWSKRALTEKDIFGIEKNGAITVTAKCIVTSLAVDMARRRGIKIFREGETQ